MPAPLMRGTHSSQGHLVTNSMDASSGLTAWFLKTWGRKHLVNDCQEWTLPTLSHFFHTWKWGRSAPRGWCICICVFVGRLPVCCPAGDTRRTGSLLDTRCSHSPVSTDDQFHHRKPGIEYRPDYLIYIACMTKNMQTTFELPFIVILATYDTALGRVSCHFMDILHFIIWRVIQNMATLSLYHCPAY